ncbi:hypothetical protein N7447_001466 [Penicillium robsamsonii]|uniref:uncharacterized protein n=1 Tax=Penicillium robsamsonii TaxID=1792511 RepID=UPI002548C505|nr:uncharacterized protein N7447_001466 [Penicillium robsamsonii]KAJ5835440.1 hypothetical protein N7447_001466 [Penicillium robsamsonii]
MSAEHSTNLNLPGGYSPVAKEESAHEGGHSPRSLWAPFFLRRLTMIIFLIGFLSCLAALIALYLYTQRQNHSLGIKTDGDRYYYLWTYGPTAVFTILTAGWTQVEYRAVQLMPWDLMLRGPTPASQSIFLDYLSKMNVVALYQSLKQKHFLVSLSIAGSLILNGITVFSTGLFELDAALIPRPVNLTVPNKFSGADYDPDMIDAKPIVSCMAFSAHNMTRPVGIYETYVYTPFEPVNSYSMGNDTIPTDRDYQADVEVIELSFDCQKATTSFEPSSVDQFTGDTPVYKTPDGCRFQQTKYAPSAMYEIDTKFGIDIDLRGCQGEKLNGTGPSYLGPYSSNWDADWRIWAAIAPSVGFEMKNTMNYTGWAKRPIHVTVCKPHYTRYRGPVRIWREAGENAISVDIRRESLTVIEGIAGVQASKLMYSGWKSASGGYLPSENAPGTEFTFAANGTSRDDLWADMAAFTDAITDSLSCLMQQTVNNKLMRHEPHQVEGTERLIEDRIFVRQMSFWLMAVLLVMLIAIVVILLCFFVPVAVCPRDTGSIGGVATILSQSPEFMGAFGGSQFKSEEKMAESRLGQTQYSTLTDTKGAFMLLPQDQPISHPLESSNGEDSSSPTWWQPFSSTWFLRITVVILPIAVIIGLEVVYHISTSGAGITPVDGKSPYIHYIWTYVPALIMFIIRCLFTSVEFNTRIIQPYSRLRQGLAPPETSILENQLRKIAPFAVFDTLRKRQWALTAATISLLLAAINPIVVSGLFTTKASGLASPMNLTQISRWNLGDPTIENVLMQRQAQQQGSQVDPTAGLLLNLNLSYPQWTYHNLVFPQFALATTEHLPPDTGFINARIPALRSRLTCAPDPANGGSCKVKRGRWACEIDSPCFPPIGGEDLESDIEYFLTDSSPRSGNIPSNCSTHAIMYGKKDPGNSPHGAPSIYHYIYCNATIEEVEVDTKFQLPSFSIDSDTPPTVVEGSARTPFKINKETLPAISRLSSYLFVSDPRFRDSVLDAITNGINGVPLDELLDSKKLINRVNEVWGIIMAQLLNTAARDSFNDPFNATYFVEPATMKAPIYTGIFHDRRKYLVQSEISTRILDGVLGSMVVCALIALYVMRTKKVLPKSPTSIASVASFLYGSRMLSSAIPNGSEWCSDEDLKTRRVFEGRTFSMGWWAVERQRNRSQSDVSSVSADETRERSGSDEGQNFLGEHNGRKETRFGIDVDIADRPLLRNASPI